MEVLLKLVPVLAVVAVYPPADAYPRGAAEIISMVMIDDTSNSCLPFIAFSSFYIH